MNDNPTLQVSLNELWDDLETNYAPSLTDEDHATLRSLDDAVIDGTLTQGHFKRINRTLMSNRRRSWQVHHLSSGATQVDPAFHKHRSATKAHLFGDYELIIDTCLGGDPVVKEAVAAADQDNRGGLASLKYHLRKAGITRLPTSMSDIMRTCEADQEFFKDPDRTAGQMKNIEKHRGKFRVSVMVDGKRLRTTFESLEEALRYRDQVVIS